MYTLYRPKINLSKYIACGETVLVLIIEKKLYILITSLNILSCNNFWCLTLCFILAQCGKVSRQRLWIVTLHARKKKRPKKENTKCPKCHYIWGFTNITWWVLNFNFCLSKVIFFSLYLILNAYEDGKGQLTLLLTWAAKCLLGSNTFVACWTECGSWHCQWGEEVTVAITCLSLPCCLLSLSQALSLFILERRQTTYEKYLTCTVDINLRKHITKRKQKWFEIYECRFLVASKLMFIS